MKDEKKFTFELGAAAKGLSPPKLQSTPTTVAQVAMDITESHPLSSNSSTSSSSDDIVIQHPSLKVSTHVHGVDYSLIHPLCVTAVMYILLEQPVAAWSGHKGTLSSKTSIYPNYSCSSGHGHH